MVLTERQDNMEMCVEVVDTFGCVLAIEINRMGHLQGLDDGPWKSLADYLVVSVQNRECRVSVVELKRTLTNNNRQIAKEQLVRSTPILRYLHWLCEVEFEAGCDLDNVVINYFILSNKDKTQLRKDHVRKRPDEVLIVESYRNIVIASYRGKSIPFKAMATFNPD